MFGDVTFPTWHVSCQKHPFPSENSKLKIKSIVEKKLPIRGVFSFESMEINPPNVGINGEDEFGGATECLDEPPSDTPIEPPGDTAFEPPRSLRPLPSPTLTNQTELDKLIRDSGVGLYQAYHLSKEMKKKNTLTHNTRISHYRTRYREFREYFTTKNYNLPIKVREFERVKVTKGRISKKPKKKLTKINKRFAFFYCSNFKGLSQKLNNDSNSQNYLLFIDSSCKSLKAVLLHTSGQGHPLIMAYAPGVPESRDSMQAILECIKYTDFEFDIIADFKVINLLIGLGEGGASSHMPCFLCLWPQHSNKTNFEQKSWPPRSRFVVNEDSLKYLPLVNSSKIRLPTLHIKLGLFSSFIRTFGWIKYSSNKKKEYKYYSIAEYLLKRHKFTSAQLNDGSITGGRINTLQADLNFERKLPRIAKQAWIAFREFSHSFFGTIRQSDWQDKLNVMLDKFQKLGVKISLKLHCLLCHLDLFEDEELVSDQHGERSHQIVKIVEENFSNKDGCNMLADLCWRLNDGKILTDKDSYEEVIVETQEDEPRPKRSPGRPRSVVIRVEENQPTQNQPKAKPSRGRPRLLIQREETQPHPKRPRGRPRSMVNKLDKNQLSSKSQDKSQSVVNPYNENQPRHKRTRETSRFVVTQLDEPQPKRTRSKFA